MFFSRQEHIVKVIKNIFYQLFVGLEEGIKRFKQHNHKIDTGAQCNLVPLNVYQ